MERKKGKKAGKEAGSRDNAPDDSGGNRADRKTRIAVIILVVGVLGLAVFFGSQLLGSSPSAPAGTGGLTVWYFYGTGCEHCVYTTPFVQSLQKKYPDVNFRILEIYENPTNRDILISMNQRLNQTKTGVPVAIVDNVVMLGGEEIPRSLESVILDRKNRIGLSK